MKTKLKQIRGIPASPEMAELPRVVKWFRALRADEQERVSQALGLFGEADDLAAQQRRADAVFAAIRKAYFPLLHADWQLIVAPNLPIWELCHRRARIIFLHHVPRVRAELVAAVVSAIVHGICGNEGADYAQRIARQLRRAGETRAAALLAGEFLEAAR